MYEDLLKRSGHTFYRERISLLCQKLATLLRRGNEDRVYDLWLKKNRITECVLDHAEKDIQTFTYKPRISVIMSTYNVSEKWLRLAVASVQNQVYQNWELCAVDDASTNENIKKLLSELSNKDSRIRVKFLEENQGISGASNVALQMAIGEYAALLDHDDELSVVALYEVVKLLQEHPEADMIYSDEDKILANGRRCNPFFKPDWSPDLFLSFMYTCHLGVYRRSLLEGIGGFRKGFEGSQDYDLVLRLTEKTDRIYHIPKILYHWRMAPGSTAESNWAKEGHIEKSLKSLEEAVKRRAWKASVEKVLVRDTYRVRWKIGHPPLVSIIIPNRDTVNLLERCIEAVDSKTMYRNYEIIILDNNSTEEQTRKFYQGLSHRVISYPHVFSLSGINNFGAKHASGEMLLFLHSDTEVINGDWLESLTEHAQRKEVGGVGCKLLYPSGRIQHAGMILGINNTSRPNKAVGYSHRFFKNGDHGYFNMIDVVRNYSAVAAACMMVRKSVFEEVGGFNERYFPNIYSDVDLCLRLRKRGYLIVYTPYAVLLHYESPSGDSEYDPQEFYYMRRTWAACLHNDPYYNPNLSLDREDFSIRI